MPNGSIVIKLPGSAPARAVHSSGDAECAPCAVVYAQEREQARQIFTPDEAVIPGGEEGALLATESTLAYWEGPIGAEGEMTGDGRLIENDALHWEDLPLPFRYVAEDTGGHQGATVVGRIDGIERQAGGVIWGNGVIDLSTEYGRRAYHDVLEALADGVSMDLDDVSFEVRIAADLMDRFEQPLEEGAETDDEGRVTVATIKSDDEVHVTTDARIRAATLVAIPAFASARIKIVEGDGAPVPPSEEPYATDTAPATATADSLTASGKVPVAPPKQWFEQPALDGPTPLRVREDGRVYGHIATWGTCHLGAQEATGECVPPPSSQRSYAYFHTGSVLTKEGGEVATGRLTVNTRHANGRANAQGAQRHYDDTGMAVADVVAGEDAWGIWVAGSVRPDATDEQIRVLRASPMSGDWRRIGTNLELVAVLGVNLGAYAIPRPRGYVDKGTMRSLVASGMLPPKRVRKPGTPGALSTADLKYLKRLANREREYVRETVEKQALRLRGEALAARVNALTASGSCECACGGTCTDASGERKEMRIRVPSR